MLSGLYLITDGSQGGRLIDKVEAALIGGAKVVQYRAKEIAPDERRETAEQLRELCTRFGALLIINDLPELARDVDADGVHLGQDDMPAVQARKIIGRDKLIGISTHSVDEALKAEAQGADYIGIGSIFPTNTKEDTTLVGIETLRRVRKAVRIPIVAIGGMTPEGAFQALEAGADSVAVISGVMADSDPITAAKEYSLLFNRKTPPPTGRVLTIAGSDSCGGAGIQADIKTITLLGSYASSVLTALTAQNTLGVQDSYIVDAEFIVKQLNAVLDDIGTDVVKTGMLSWGGIVTRVAHAIESRSLLAVVDPVMIAKGGASLLDHVALDSLISRLLPQAYLLTPNLPEAEAMSGIEPRNVKEMVEAGRALQELGARNVLVKGGHLNDDATDVLLCGDDEYLFTSQRFETANTHGTGCTLASAIATFLAQGYPLRLAVERGKRFISLAIEHSVSLGRGHGPVNHIHAARLMLSEEE
ncbi:MAG: phosphomethylpyrimidine kinase [Desulfuromonas sp.]|nr:MAG: phosphomethylpyrimidine kinase [Desulfuromonas sp.]